MSDYHIYIKMPSYLRQWFIHRHSGTDPVRLNNGSIESKLIKLAIVRPPESIIPHRQQKDLIYLYMEQRGIKEDGTCWDSIAKIYQRLRKNYLTNVCRQKNRTTKGRNKNNIETTETEEG